MRRRVLHERVHGVEPAPVRERADVRLGIAPVSDAQRRRHLDEALREALRDGLVYAEARRGDAHLAHVAELSARARLGRALGIGVREDEHGGVPAEFERRGQQPLGAEPQDLAPDGHRSGERRLADHARAEQVTAHLRRLSGHHVQHAGGKARVFEGFGEREGHARRLFGGLQDHRAAGRERGRDLARRQQHREVPRREGGDRADRLAHHEEPALARARLDHAAVDAPRLVRVPVEMVGRARDLRARLRERFALLLRHRARDRFGSLAHEPRRGAEHGGARPGIGRAPAPPGAFGRRERAVEIRRRRARDRVDRLLGRRVDDVDARAVGGGRPDAVDPHLARNDAHSAISWRSRCTSSLHGPTFQRP